MQGSRRLLDNLFAIQNLFFRWPVVLIDCWNNQESHVCCLLLLKVFICSCSLSLPCSTSESVVFCHVPFLIIQSLIWKSNPVHQTDSASEKMKANWTFVALYVCGWALTSLGILFMWSDPFFFCSKLLWFKECFFLSCGYHAGGGALKSVFAPSNGQWNNFHFLSCEFHLLSQELVRWKNRTVLPPPLPLLCRL